jgi:transaldolase
MQLFLDTGSLSEVQSIASLGILGGVTTNPTLLASQGQFEFKATIQQICALVDGPVSAEVVATDMEDMLREAREIATWAPNVVVKIPLTENGLRAISIVSREGIRVNTTLIFSPPQALAAALAGAAFVSPFVGRLDDAGQDGMQVVRDTVQIFRTHAITTRVLAASIRHPVHVVEAAKAGADCATIPYKVLIQMLKHPLTDIGLERFLSDWERVTGSRKLPLPQAQAVRT